MKNSIKKIIFALIVLGFLTVSFEAWALQVDWPDSPLGTPLDDDSQLTDLVQYLYEWGIFLGGMAVFIALLIAGFQYLTSVGDPTKMKESWNRIQSAFFGLVLLLSSFLVLHTINPELTVLRPPVFKPGWEVEEGEKKPGLDELLGIPCDKLEVVVGKTEKELKDGTAHSLFPLDCVSVGTGWLQHPILHIRSKAFIGGERAHACAGLLMLYSGANCKTEITSLPPNTSYFKSGTEINSIMLFVEKKEDPTAIGCTLKANPATIYRPREVTITWTTRNADSFSIEPAIDAEPLELNGSRTFQIAETTTYILVPPLILLPVKKKHVA